MKVELNIRLDLKGGGGTLSGNDDRCRFAIAHLRDKFGVGVQIERRTKLVDDEGVALVYVDQLVVKFNFNGDYEYLIGVIYGLCIFIDQDCIAMYRPESGKGGIVGPNADGYGKFDINKFE